MLLRRKKNQFLFVRKKLSKNGREIMTFFLPRVEKSQVERNAVDLSANQTFNGFFQTSFSFDGFVFYFVSSLT